MKMTVVLVATVCLSFEVVVAAHAGPREDLANEVRDEIVTRRMSCVTEYGQRDPCGHRNSCNEAMAAIGDFQVDLADPSTQKRAVYKWWRFVSGTRMDAGCMRALLSTSTYCKAVNLVNKFDPHTNCPSGGGTNASCWVNRDWEINPLLLKGEEIDWLQSCELSD
jgi:hypothetical protein